MEKVYVKIDTNYTATVTSLTTLVEYIKENKLDAAELEVIKPTHTDSTELYEEVKSFLSSNKVTISLKNNNDKEYRYVHTATLEIKSKTSSINLESISDQLIADLHDIDERFVFSGVSDGIWESDGVYGYYQDIVGEDFESKAEFLKELKKLYKVVKKNISK